MIFPDQREVSRALLFQMRPELDKHIDKFVYDPERAKIGREERSIKTAVINLLYDSFFEGKLLSINELVDELEKRESHSRYILLCRGEMFYKGFLRELDTACKLMSLYPDLRIFRSALADMSYRTDLLCSLNGEQFCLQVSINGASSYKFRVRKDKKLISPVIELIADSNDIERPIPLIPEFTIKEAIEKRND